MPRLSQVAALCFVAVLPLRAQESPQESTAAQKSPIKWGVGVSLTPVALIVDEDFGFLPIGFSNFLLPIQVSPTTTIEPEFGLFRTSSEGSGFSSSFNNSRLGIGLLLGLKERAGLRPYLGPRFGISRTSTESSSPGGGSTSKQTTWHFSGVFGAQHFFSEHFSLGGEVQLTRASVGEPEPSTGNPSQTFVTSAGVILLRWFF